MQKITRDLLLEKASSLLKNGVVNRVLGWKSGDFDYDVTPAVFETEEELKKDLILPFDFDPNTIGAKEIVSERQGLYAATIDNCTVYVDTENYVLQFKKTVRRPSKYAKKLMTWNEESINETYYITASALCCRKTCRSNINDEMQSVLERFASVK